MPGALVLIDQLRDAAIFPDHVMGGDFGDGIAHALQCLFAGCHAGIVQHQHVERVLALIEIRARGAGDVHQLPPDPIFLTMAASGSVRF